MAKVVEVDLVDNTEEVLAALNEQVVGWLEAIGEDAAGTAADRAPVDTGRLKGSISHAVAEGEKAVYIGTNVEYAPYQEFEQAVEYLGNISCSLAQQRIKLNISHYLKNI